MFQVKIFPVEGDYKIRDFHNWVIEVTDESGPVEGAAILMSGGMDAHGHGLPSQPEVTKALGAGRYLIEGVLFNMAGLWNLQFLIRTQKIEDLARFDITLEF